MIGSGIEGSGSGIWSSTTGSGVVTGRNKNGRKTNSVS